MKPLARSILGYFTDFRSILVGFAIFNFATIWLLDAQIHFTCAACPWYHPWSGFNEPTLLLAACLFLRVNGWWANTVALLLTGYLIGYFVRLFVFFEHPLSIFMNCLKLLERQYPYFVASWESQYLLAVVVFIWAMLSLKSNLQSRKVLYACKS